MIGLARARIGGLVATNALIFINVLACRVGKSWTTEKDEEINHADYRLVRLLRDHSERTSVLFVINCLAMNCRIVSHATFKDMRRVSKAIAQGCRGGKVAQSLRECSNLLAPGLIGKVQ